MSQKCALFIDARNLMYRAIFASKKPQYKFRPQHPFTIMLHFMSGWVNRFKPSSVNIFWDAKRSTLWRKKIFPGYKDKSDKYAIDIKDDLINIQIVAKDMFPYLGCKQFNKDYMEADDLIYAACKTVAPHNVVVCSSDSDYKQLAFRMSHVKCFDPMRETFMEPENYDPVVQKALCGDNSDMINGYAGIGPVKSKAMAKSSKDRIEYLNKHGWSLYVRNLLLIDLSLCPELLKNQLYIQRAIENIPVFDKNKLLALAQKYKINGFATEFNRFGAQFKKLTVQDDESSPDEEDSIPDNINDTPDDGSGVWHDQE